MVIPVNAPLQRRPTPGPDHLVAGRYRLRRRIGGGGMGAVWLAHDQLLDRDVAVKQVLSTEGLTPATAAELRDRALHEGRLAARLAHRNAVAMHDVALERGEPWLVMEYVPSRSVAAVLHLAGSLPVAQSAQIGAQIANAMVEAHRAGILHRDIKPGNILIASGAEAGLVKITDFGIARATDDVSLTDSEVITGTPAFFAPEVARGDAPTEASDVYSLGATVYTMAEGRPPFGIDEDSMVLLHRVARGVITPPTRSGDLRDGLLAMLEPSPARRPTMAQARDMLVAAAAGPNGSAARVLTERIRTLDGTIPSWARYGMHPDPATHDRINSASYRRVGATSTGPSSGPGSSTDAGSSTRHRSGGGENPPSATGLSQPRDSSPRRHHDSPARGLRADRSRSSVTVPDVVPMPEPYIPPRPDDVAPRGISPTTATIGIGAVLVLLLVLAVILALTL